MPRFAANLTMMFNEFEFLDRFAAAAEAGFKAVEILFPYKFPAQEVAARLRDQGLTLALFNLPLGNAAKGERGLAAIPGREADFEAAMCQALDYALITGCRRIHSLAGPRSQGAQLEVYVSNLKKGARMAADFGVELLIEPINTRDMPDYFLNTTAAARDVIAAAGEPNLGLQFDLYHRQIQEGDVTRAIREFAPLTRHYQIANPPDRHEPDQGEMNYRYLFTAIDATSYEGYVGCEYKPRAGTRAGLGWAEQCGVTLG